MALKKFSTQVKDFGGTICSTYSDPLDPRVIVEFETDLWEHAGDTFGVIHEEYCKVYEGIKVYVEETNSTYEYVGPIEPDFGIKISDANHRGNWRAVSTPGTDANVVVTTLVADDGSEVTPEAYAHKNNKDELVSTDKNKLYILSRDPHTKKEDSRYDYDHNGWIETTTEDSVDGKTHNALIIRHSDVQRTDTEDAIQKEIDVELKFPFVDEIETDEKGHIIGVNTKTVSWDPEKNYAYKYIKVDDTCPLDRTDESPNKEEYNGLETINKSLPEAIVPTTSVKTELTADSETDTLTFKDDRWIHVEASKDGEDDTITITHENVERKDEKVSLHKSVDEKIVFEVIDEIKTDEKGHITGVRTNTFDYIPADNYAFKTIVVNDTHPGNRTDAKPEVKTYNGTNPIEASVPEAVVSTSTVSTSLVAESETDTLTFTDDRWIHVGAIADSDTISILHESVDRKDEEVIQNKSVDEKVTFNMVDEVISDVKGHVTGIRTNTFTWNPADNYAYKTINVDDVHPTRTDTVIEDNEKHSSENVIPQSLQNPTITEEHKPSSIVANSETDSLTFTDDDWIHIEAVNSDEKHKDVIKIEHEDVTREDAQVYQEKTIDKYVKLNVVDEVKTDEKGHITGVRTNTFEWNPEHNYAFKTIKAVTSNVLDRTDAHQDATSKNMLEAVNTTSDSTTTLVADSEIDTLTFKDDKYISIVADDSSNTLTFSHESVQRFDGDTTQTKETDKDLSVQIVDLVITDAKGHVTGVRTNTLSIPRDTNFGYKKFEVAGNSVVTNTNKNYTNTGSSTADHEDDTMKIQGDTWMNVTIADDQINLSHGVSSDRYNVASNNKNTDDTYEYKSEEKPKIYTSEESNPADTYDTKNNNVITSIVTDDTNHLISTTYRTDIPTKVWVQWEIENAMKSTDAMVFKGGFDPADALPTSNDGSILSGYTYKITDNGTITLGDEVRTVVIGDTLISTADDPTSADWMILETRNDRATKSVPGNVIVGDGIDVDTSGKISLDVINYGSGINSVYINDNKQVVASTETVGSTTKPIYLNNGTITESNATVGSSIKPMYLQDGTLTASSDTIGSGVKPMYLNEGTLTASTETIGSSVKPMYLNEGTLTVSTGNVGSSKKPMYLSNGTLTESSETVGSGIIPTFLSSGTITPSNSNVGTSKKPMYMVNGTLTECTYELNAKVNSGTKDTLAYYSGTDEVSSFTDKVGSETKLWYLNNGVPTESTSNIGSDVIPMYLNDGDLTASTADVGSPTVPMYMNKGTLTASNANVGSGTNPMYISNGTLTASTANVGKNTENLGTPVYMNAGTLTAVTNINSGLLSNLGDGVKIADGKLTFDLSNTPVVETIDGSDGVTATKEGNTYLVSIIDSGVTTAKIANSNVTEAKLATDSVVTAKIKDANVTDVKLATDSVITSKIKDANVTESKLATDSVTTAKIKDANVTTAKLAAGAVTTEKLADKAITKAKLGSDVFADLDATVSNTAPANLIVSVTETDGVLTSLSVTETNASSSRTASTTAPAYTVTNANGIATGADLTNLKGYVDDSLSKVSGTIASVNNPTVTLKNGTSDLGSFTLNLTSDKSIDLSSLTPTVNDTTITLKNGTIELGSFSTNQSSTKSIDLSSLTPAVNNSTVTFKNGTTELGSFSTNQTSNSTIDLSSLVTAIEFPEAPNVSNATVTLKNGSTNLDSFTLNQTSNKEIDLSSLISTVNDSKVTLKNGSADLGSFTLNQSSNKEIDLSSICSDTKNTAGSTNNENTLLYLIGAGSQGTNPLTYSNKQVYVGTDNCMYAPTYYATSDMRYKTVLNDLKLNVEQIANLPTFDFEWKDGSGKSTGTSAQAVKEILPNLVSGEDKLTLNYGALGAVEGIILARKIVELENRIVELENKLKQ